MVGGGFVPTHPETRVFGCRTAGAVAEGTPDWDADLCRNLLRQVELAVLGAFEGVQGALPVLVVPVTVLDAGLQLLLAWRVSLLAGRRTP